MRRICGRLSLSLAALSLSLAAAACGRPKAETRPPEVDHAAMGHGAPADTAAPMLTVSREERARLGVVMAAAESRVLTRDVRLVGRVVPAETAARTITSKVDGFVERLYVDYTGREVRRGEPLFELYSPMVVAAGQELLLALRLRNTLGGAAGPARANADSLVDASRRRLRYWDLDDAQIAEIERGGTMPRTVTFRAPTSGTVMQKNVVQGQSVMAGAPLLQIADLSTVWLEADVFESDLGAVRPGMAATVDFDAFPGEPARGRVTWIAPTVDAASRTGKVRIELANGAGRVRPGLFGTVRLAAPVNAGRAVIVIPRQAALVTGDRQLVFVEDEMGMLVPRLVTLGAETDSLVEVKSGLRAGERVAGSAAFLLDAETNLGAAMAGMNMDSGARNAAHRH